jgi:hypothetical protein
VTFFADDSGVATSKPVDLYEFTNTLGTVTRRTNFARDFVFGGQTYFATADLERGQFAIVGGFDVPEMTVQMPMSDPLVDAYAGVGTPPQKWRVTITRVQRTSMQGEQVFSGYVRACDLSSKRVAVFTIADTLDAGPETPLPNVIMSPICNHVLYDSLCKILRVGNSISPTFTIASDFRTLTISSLGAFTSTDLKFGDAFHPVSGERRSIVLHNNLTVVLDVPLQNAGALAAANGQKIQLFRG